MTRNEFYWCTKHQRVESGDNLCPARHRVGPFDTPTEAQHAMDRVRERNEDWEAEDARWHGRDG